MLDFLRNLRHAVRQLIRQPAFAAAAIGSLALGIGLNTTLFSIVNAVLLRDSAMRAPDRLVEVYTGLTKDSHSSRRPIQTFSTFSEAPRP